MKLTVTPRQLAFIRAGEFEVLYGGAAGGGKSYGQVADALIYALKYPGSKQLMLRRSYGELERSLIRTAMALYPQKIFTYLSSKHSGRFSNGSVLDFGSLESETDIYKFQSAEYDVIRFDELTHFTQEMYLYLISRVRGVNRFPKAVKSSTNPGGIGHGWVKARFIDPAAPDTPFTREGMSRIFLPAFACDNRFLMESDPGYVARLALLCEKDRRALLEGDWDIFEGQYFTEFDRRVHVTAPFEIPAHWRRYRTLDYGLDMLACLFIACDEQGNAYVYNEVYEKGLIVSEAAKRILAASQGEYRATFAPPDLWNRHKDTGRSTAEIFLTQGILLTRAENSRVQGWLDLKEWLAVRADTQGQRMAAMKIFSCCRNLIRTLPALCTDRTDPNDVSDTPHELTHAPDALRYFAAGRPCPAATTEQEERHSFFTGLPRADALGRGERTRII